MPLNLIRENRHSLPIMVVLTLAALIIAFGEDSWRQLLQFDRAAIASENQWWRWLTAHLVHASWSHTLLNLGGLWVVWLLFKRRMAGWGGLFIALFGVLIMDLGFWFRDVELSWYVGMSGLLHTFYTAGAWDEIWRGEKSSLWLLLGVVAKLVYEQYFGALPLTAESSGGPVWVNAHLYGAVGGLLAASLLNVRQPFVLWAKPTSGT